MKKKATADELERLKSEIEYLTQVMEKLFRGARLDRDARHAVLQSVSLHRGQLEAQYMSLRGWNRINRDRYGQALVARELVKAGAPLGKALRAALPATQLMYVEALRKAYERLNRGEFEGRADPSAVIEALERLSTESLRLAKIP